MDALQDLFDLSCYGVEKAKKSWLLTSLLNELTARHYESCGGYRSILDAYGYKPATAKSLEDLPFVPVRLFKHHELMSIERSKVFKTLMSSGTTGQSPSKIFLDAETARLQTKALAKIITSYIGAARLPMLIIDHPGIVKDRRSFSARGAGILGMSTFGRDHTYALKDESMEIDREGLDRFSEKHKGLPIIAFGFTFMVWQYLVQGLMKANRRLEYSNATLVHSGGWKKLEEFAVSNESFKEGVRHWAGIERVFNFYGMVEQVGSVFMECECGNLHAPIFSDVVVRDPYDWQPKAFGEEGIIEVLSCLPQSYPGHALLTEDRGVILGEDDCACGRKGRYFRILGRVPKAEIRGCSDTHASQAA